MPYLESRPPEALEQDAPREPSAAGTTAAGATAAGEDAAAQAAEPAHATHPGTTHPGTTHPGTTHAGTTHPGTTDAGATYAGTTHPGTTEAGQQTSPGAQPSPLRQRLSADLDLFVGFVGGAVVGLVILELGFWRTFVIGGCGALGVIFVRRHDELLAKLKQLF